MLYVAFALLLSVVFVTILWLLRGKRHVRALLKIPFASFLVEFDEDDRHLGPYETLDLREDDRGG